MKVGTAAGICMSIVQSAHTHCCGSCHHVIVKYACCLAQVEGGSFLFGYVFGAAIACMVLGNPTLPFLAAAWSLLHSSDKKHAGSQIVCMPLVPVQTKVSSARTCYKLRVTQRILQSVQCHNMLKDQTLYLYRCPCTRLHGFVSREELQCRLTSSFARWHPDGCGRHPSLYIFSPDLLCPGKSGCTAQRWWSAAEGSSSNTWSCLSLAAATCI